MLFFWIFTTLLQCDIICQHKNSIWGRGKSFFVKAWMTSHRLAFTKRCQFLLVHPAVFLSRLSHVPPLGNEYIYLSPWLESYYFVLTYNLLLHIGFGCFIYCNKYFEQNNDYLKQSSLSIFAPNNLRKCEDTYLFCKKMLLREDT